jgi:hypothetical protein
MKNYICALVFIIVTAAILVSKCSSPIIAGSTEVFPENFPGSAVTGIQFPTDSTTIYSWINDSHFANHYDSASIYAHSWGIWAGLTMPTNQKVDNANLRVFETWMGLNEVRQYIIDGLPCTEEVLTRTSRVPLTRPRQFEHAGKLARSVNALAAKVKPGDTAVPKDLWVTVSYSPDMACYAINNKLFKQSVINTSYQRDKVGSIPPFPNTSISIKPTYLEYPGSATILQMPVWLNPPNPPDSLNVFAPDQFPLCVYVDVKNRQQTGKKLVPVTAGCKSKDSIANATCNLNDFINFTIDSAMAAFMNQQDSVQGMNNNGGYGKAQPGNRVLLVAMHVSTKETSDWTWQTFYWTPTPATPGAPSSNLAAGLLPATVKGAARNYAVNAAYVMTTPNNSPTNAGSMFGYNPYLEGGFGPATFNIPNTFNPSFQYGMQTNCMSCHALAVPSTATGYTTDQFINPDDPQFFKNQVTLDFSWSIQTALINDTIPYWNFGKQ